MPISAIRNGTDAPPRSGGFRAQRVLGDRIADGDDYAELARRVGAPETSQLIDLAATAHELRLPLGHIKGFVSSLRRTDVTWDEAARSEFLAEIEIETDRLTQLV